MGFYKWFRKAMSVFRVLSATTSGTVQVGGTSRNLAIDVSDNTNAALRVTQRGTGNALLVEDTTNPDSTPFIVDANGRLTIGSTAALDAQQLLGIQSQANFSGIFTTSYGDTNDRAFFDFTSRARNTPASPAIVQSGDTIETYVYRGYDGTAFINAARIDIAVDGVPGVGDMPGRIVFSTSPDGSMVPTERLRIDSAGLFTVTGNQVINTNSASDALRITQLGAGNALVIEDSTNPDATPFLVNAEGRVVQNHTALTAVGAISTQHYQIHGNASVGIPSFNMSGWNASNLAGIFSIAKSRGTSAGDFTIVQNGDQLGNFQFYGSDGTQHVMAASIQAAVDGTPGTNDMPGRIVFSTTADGASSPSEKMRLDNAGNVTIGSPTQYGVPGLATNKLVLTGASINDASIQQGVFTAAGGDGPRHTFIYSRNATVATHGLVANGDFLGEIRFAGSDGASYLRAAQISVVVDGTPGLNDMPGRIVFFTTPDGQSVPIEALRISSNKQVRQAATLAIPAGGAVAQSYCATSTANFGVFFGSGAPTVSAAKGSLYLRSDGTTTNDRAYINTDGATTWTALTTVA